MRICVFRFNPYRWFGSAVVALILVLDPGSLNAADEITRWTEQILAAIRADNSPPTLASRNLAILHTATYDTINSITKTHQPYRFHADAAGETSIQAAAAAAGHTVLVTLYPKFQALFDQELQQQLAPLGSSLEIANGIDLGRHIGRLTLDSRKADGSSTQITYVPLESAGQWRRTSPWFRPPLDPHWGRVRPFCIPSTDEFLPPGPPRLASARYAAEFNEVKQLGNKTSTVRTQEQSLIATFWSDFNYTVTPPGHWQQIAMELATRRGNTLAENARMFALLSLAQADAAIVAWDAKYRFNFWRPITAIRRAIEDDNPATATDLEWDSLLSAPHFPEYPSGHSTFSAASAVVLAAFFGSNDVAFSIGSDSLPGVQRQFRELWECADEVGMSRIYGGIHFSSANRDGKISGARVGYHVVKNFLLPQNSLPTLVIAQTRTGSVSLRLHGRLGSKYRIEGSETLSDWRPVAVCEPAIGGTLVPMEQLDPAVQFFRVRPMF